MSRPDFAPLRHFGYRLLGRTTGDPRRMAVKRWQHAPGGMLRQQPPIFLDGDLERVIDISPRSTFEIERQRLFADSTPYPATELFELHDATVIRGQIFCGPGILEFRRRTSGRRIRPAITEDVGSAFIPATIESSSHFDDWLTGQLATELLAHHLGLNIRTNDPAFVHARDYRHLTPWRTQALPYIRAAKLLVASDAFQNPSRINRQIAIRRLFRQCLGDVRSAELVMLQGASPTGRPALCNTGSVAELVEWLGGIVINPDSMDVRGIAQALGSARVVIGVEDCRLAHAIMLAPADATLLVLQPPGQFHNLMKTFTDAIGQRYAFLVCEPTADGFLVPMDRLSRLLDRLAEFWYSSRQFGEKQSVSSASGTSV